MAIPLKRVPIMHPDEQRRVLREACAQLALHVRRAVEAEGALSAEPAPANMYGGSLGKAAALAVAARAMGYAALADAAVRVLRHPSNGQVSAVDPWELGIARGPTARAHAYLSVGSALESASHLDEAAVSVRMLAREVERIGVESLPCLDVMHGVAGFLLVAAEVSLLRPDPELRGRLRDLMGRIAKRVRHVDDAARHDLGPSFSHGLSGIGHALLRAGERFACDDAVAAAELCMSWAHEAYATLIASRARAAIAAADVSWCRGVTGSTLAHLSSLEESAHRPDVLRQICEALDLALHFRVTAESSLCCGTLGRLEMLRVGAERLREPSLATLAGSAVCLLWDALAPSVAQVTEKCSGLYQGSAGFLYVCAKLLTPNARTSILAGAA